MDSTVFTDTLRSLIDMCGRNGVVGSATNSLLNLLVPIDFCFAILVNMMSFGGNGYLPLMFSKIMRYGFWIWFVRNWDMLINALIESLTEAGAGFGTLDAGIIERPSQIIDKGFEFGVVYLKTMSSISLGMTNLGKSLIILILALVAFVGIVTAFAYIALNAFITVLEFHIVSALLLLFVPFAVNDRTARYAENAMGFIVGCGVKMMFMAAIISFALNQADVLKQVSALSWREQSLVGWETCISSAIMAWIFAFLAVQVPALAAGAMSGAPSLTGSMAQSAAMGAAAMAGGAIGSSIGGSTKLAGAVSGARSAAAASGVGAGVMAFGRGLANMATTGLQNTYDNAQGATEKPFGQYHNRNVGTASTAATKRENNAMGNTSKQESKGNGTGT